MSNSHFYEKYFVHHTDKVIEMYGCNYYLFYSGPCLNGYFTLIMEVPLGPG